MKELVSTCYTCGKNLYCLDGFFNGVYTDEQQSFCYDCVDKKEKSTS